jgi:hypothetical protein
MKKEFVMRGKTASGLTEVLNFSGYKPGYAYRLTEFEIYPSTSIGDAGYELLATITAAKTYEDPANPNFNNEGLIGVALNTGSDSANYPESMQTIVNDTFLITQNLILAVIDTKTGSPMAVNWQCRFVAEKMNNAEEAAANFKQYSIFDG